MIKQTKQKPTIGMEVHVELSTKSKMFCGCSANHFSKKPNSHTCPTCLGLPGALPFPNEKAIEWTVMLGLALNCSISKSSKFDRKHYFYPDLPKGYQISQYDKPLCVGGYLETSEGKVGITRVHLEEDTAKLKHTKDEKGGLATLIDFNRSGVALVEIVTDPDIHSASQAKEFTKELQKIIRTLGISSCDMDKGSMRLEANISMGIDLGYKVEVKNLNSFKFVEKAIDYELDRQNVLLKEGKKIKQETRGWDEKLKKTVHQRYKETESDYRYFPEPDIPPIKLDINLINKLRKGLPQLPDEIAKEIEKEYKIKPEYAQIISLDTKLLNYSRKALKIGRENSIDANTIMAVIINRKINIEKVSEEKLISLQIEKKDKVITKESEITKMVDEAMKENSKAVTDYKKGSTNAISVLIGYVMKVSSGKADPKIVRAILEEKL